MYILKFNPGLFSWRSGCPERHWMIVTHGHLHSLETKNMMPAAKERLNLSKAEKWAKERIPAMIPAKQDMAERIIKARVAFQ